MVYKTCYRSAIVGATLHGSTCQGSVYYRPLIVNVLLQDCETLLYSYAQSIYPFKAVSSPDCHLVSDPSTCVSNYLRMDHTSMHVANMCICACMYVSMCMNVCVCVCVCMCV